jgi:2-polyprenyl-3-methyl-5-hydroxy-6-metoxy-1,4-benzoquinol methylase
MPDVMPDVMPDAMPGAMSPVERSAAQSSAADVKPRAWWRRIWHTPRAHRSLPARYDAAAGSWHRTIVRLGYLAAYAEMIDSVRPQLRRALTGSGGRAILDAGAGTGAFSLALATWYYEQRVPAPLQVDLLDASPAMLRHALQNHAGSGASTTAVCGDIATLDERHRRYAVVVCSHVIEHAADPVHALATLRETLTPGGVLLLVVSSPHWCTRLLQMKWRNASWHEQVVIGLLQRAGFSEAQVFRFREGPPSRTSIGYIVERTAV